MMHVAARGASSKIPAQVRSAILSDASCSFFRFCHSGTREVIPIEDISPPTSSLPPATVTTATTAVMTKEVAAEESDLSDWQLVYDVMRVRKGSVLFLKDHVERIQKSCELALPRLYDINNVKKTTTPFLTVDVMHEIMEYIRCYKRGDEDVNLKFLTWIPNRRDVESAPKVQSEQLHNFSFVVYFVKSIFPPPAWYLEGTRVALLYNAQRHTPNAKIMQTLLRARAKSLQELTDSYEVLLVRSDTEHYLIPEGSRSNYLVVTKDNRLFCSLEKDILVGITLQAIQRTLAAARLPSIHHQQLHVGDLCMAKAVALLGTSPGVLPVREILLHHDAESEREFLTALDDYEKCVPMDGRAKLSRELILSYNGRLQLSSAQDPILCQLREVYEIEASR